METRKDIDIDMDMEKLTLYQYAEHKDPLWLPRKKGKSQKKLLYDQEMWVMGLWESESR